MNSGRSHQPNQQGRSQRIAPGLAFLAALLLIPLTTLADPGGAASPDYVQQVGGAVLDDAALLNVRGRGAELPKGQPTQGEIAVILWDESGTGATGGHMSQSHGTGNVQTHGLTLNGK